MSNAMRFQNWLGDGYTVMLAEPLPKGDPLDPITRYVVRYLDRPETVVIKVRADLTQNLWLVAIEDDPEVWYEHSSTVEPLDRTDGYQLPELRAAIRSRFER